MDNSKSLGSVYTPDSVAEFLVDWAIGKPSSNVLDIGTGEGSFIFASYRKLIRMGCREPSKQIFGVELDPLAISRFDELWDQSNLGKKPQIVNSDFFDTEFNIVDAVIGNPPYVRRANLNKVDKIRTSIEKIFKTSIEISRLADLYIYFLVYATQFLIPSGKLAVIISSSWMDVGYGKEFKRFLLDNYWIEAIIASDRRVFEDALIKPVLLLAKRKDITDSRESQVRFMRMLNGFDKENIRSALLGSDNPDVHIYSISQDKLKFEKPWGMYLRVPKAYEKILNVFPIINLGEIAATRIGLQTLAKDFYILNREKAKNIEKQYIRPMAVSPRDYSRAIIDSEISPEYWLFYCEKGKGKLKDTKALEHILWGEDVRVPVRGKGKTVKGFHNKRRLQQDNRRPWYNIKEKVSRRGVYSILFPRRIYENYLIIWNKAQLVPNEDFLEIEPRDENDRKAMLAVFNSSFFEVVIRMNAQIYGGGVYNVNPGQLKELPVLNFKTLTNDRLSMLNKAFIQFSIDHKRRKLDKVICNAFNISNEILVEIDDALEELKSIATKAK